MSQEYVSEGKPEELSPATFTHTDRIGNNQQVATFSPMLCEKGSINLFGVSLSCEDEPTNFDFGGKGIDPYRPVAEDESIGAIAMPPADFQKLVEMGSHESLKEGYGLASTALAHTKGGNGVVYPNDSRISAPKKKMKARKNAKKACERCSYFVYVLEKGVDLTQHGMAIVYDGNWERHCSLVHLSDSFAFADDSAPEWYHRPVRYHNVDVVLPGTPFRSIDEISVNLDPLKDADQPELQNILINGIIHCVFPKVASLFSFAGFQMRASAVPLPLEDFDDDEQCTMRMVALIVYNINNNGDEEFQSAVFELENEKYWWKNIAMSSRLALRYAMKEALANKLCYKLTKYEIDRMWVEVDGEDDEQVGEKCDYILEAALFDLAFVEPKLSTANSTLAFVC